MGGFYYYERLGIGRVTNVRYENLELYSGVLVYVNVYVENVLGECVILIHLVV